MCLDCGCGPWWRGYSPPPWVWRDWESAPRFGWPMAGPAESERKASLEARKKRLEQGLAEVNDALGLGYTEAKMKPAVGARDGM